MIVLCAGGTGGHVFPAESLAEILKSRGHSLALITDSRAMNFVNYECFDKILVLNVKRSNSIVYLFSLSKAILKAIYFMLSNPVKIAIGFGGYPSLPGMVAAQLLFKKTVLHEQNAVLGRANKFLNTFSKGIATSFENTIGICKNAVWLGNPLRQLVHNAMQKPKANNDKLNLIVIGGSQGARLFSDIIPKAIAKLPQNLQEKLHITQQCRLEDLENVRKFYQSLKVSFHLETFFSDLPMHMRNSDLAICRAGASTIAELTCLGLPAILVPLAISKDNDQGENAKSIVASGGGLLMLEKEFTSDALAEQLHKLLVDHNILPNMSQAIIKLGKPKAGDHMADWAEGFL